MSQSQRLDGRDVRVIPGGFLELLRSVTRKDGISKPLVPPKYLVSNASGRSLTSSFQQIGVIDKNLSSHVQELPPPRRVFPEKIDYEEVELMKSIAPFPSTSNSAIVTRGLKENRAMEPAWPVSTGRDWLQLTRYLEMEDDDLDENALDDAEEYQTEFGIFSEYEFYDNWRLFDDNDEDVFNSRFSCIEVNQSTHDEDHIEDVEAPIWYKDLSDPSLKESVPSEIPLLMGANAVNENVHTELVPMPNTGQLLLSSSSLQDRIAVSVDRRVAERSGAAIDEYGEDANSENLELSTMEHASQTRPSMDRATKYALTLAGGRESFQEAFDALRKFTQASSVRGSFHEPNLPAVKLEEDENAGKAFASLAVPKDEPIDGTIPEQAPFSDLALKVDPSWNLRCYTKGEASYKKAHKILMTLEELWIKRSQEQRRLPDGQLRPDFLHWTIAAGLKREGLCLNDKERPIGHCPGVPVGSCFRFRVEMAVVGLHCALQDGIGVIPARLSPYEEPVATSVVLLTNHLTSFYKDDKDMGDVVVYSGQGGRNRKTGERRDQILTRGNLALANSRDRGIPIRLIRGHRYKNCTSGRLYSYDGLYKVSQVEHVVGVHGKKVFLFTLHRLDNQGPLPSVNKASLLYRSNLREQLDAFRRRESKNLKITFSTFNSRRLKDRHRLEWTTTSKRKHRVSPKSASAVSKDMSTSTSSSPSSGHRITSKRSGWVPVEVQSPLSTSINFSPSRFRF